MSEQAPTAAQRTPGSGAHERRFANEQPRPEGGPNGSIPERTVLDRLEVRTAQLSRAYMKMDQIEAELAKEREAREELMSGLEDEQARSARLERRLRQAEARLDAAAATEDEFTLVHETVRSLEAELERTRAQLEVVRGDAAAKRLPLWRRIFWRLGRR